MIIIKDTAKIAVFTVVYPEVEPYLDDFLFSIQSQTCRAFELCIINDGFSGLENYLKKYTLPHIVKSFSGNPTEIRKQGIQFLCNEPFDYVVFADSDDCFDSRRIEIISDLLNNYDLVCNEIILFGQQLEGYVPFGLQRFNDGDSITIETIYHSNIMGMSNTGARVNCIKPLLNLIPSDIIAFDWLLFSLSLLNGYKCVFTNKTCTYYRQHTANVASTLDYSDEQILRGLKVKTQHYAQLSRLYPAYKNIAISYRLLTERNVDPNFRNYYCEAIRMSAPKDPLWWEMIKTDKELNV